MIRKVSGATNGRSRPTLRDVAREAGVSLKTASRVLNKEPYVQDATARLVLDAMARLEYQPNEMARGLKGSKSGLIGIVAANLSHEFIAGCVEAVHRSVHLAGKTVMLTLSGGDPVVERRHVQLMLRRQVEGLIVFPTGSSLTKELGLEIGETPAVAIDNPSTTPSIASVMVPNRKASREAMEHLLHHGYRRVALVGARSDWKTIRERIAGAQQAVSDAGASCLDFVCRTEEKLSVESLMLLLRNRRTAPRAIFTLSSYASEQVLHAAMRMGLRVPEDLAVVGFDDFRMADLIGLTAVSQPIESMGAAAVQLLLNKQAGQQKKERVVLATTLMVRRSCGCTRGE